MKRLLALTAVVALLAMMSTANALESVPPPRPFQTAAGPSTRIAGEYPLAGGRLLVNFVMPSHVGWAVVVPGTEIGREPLSLQGGTRDTLTLTPPGPGNGQEARLASQQLAASGWTQAVQLALFDLLTAGVTPASAISQIEPQRSSAAGDPDPDRDFFAQGCAMDTADNGINARGCYRRYWGYEDDSVAYEGATSFATAGVTNDNVTLKIITTAHTYGNAKMVEYNPMSTAMQGNCATVGLSLSAYDVSVSESQQVCPERLEPTILEDGTVYGVDWRGSVTSGTRATELVEISRMAKIHYPGPGTQSNGFKYHMDFRAEPTCNPSPGGGCIQPTPEPKDIVQDLLH
ncbi:MAG: hypothetical protein QOF60_910 [Actinomycetota bacterium]|jgi:hypothetical protein|nr:hypothetical protein [Actinomycetota bacterium]